MTDALRDLVLRRAREEADALVADTEQRAAALLERERAQAATLVERAQAAGRDAGTVKSARELALARREASAQVLVARREAYEELGRRACTALLALRDDPGYEALVERLGARVRRQLGPDAAVERDPDRGGVVGRAGPRRVDLTLVTLAARCIEELGTRAEELWR